MSHINLCELCYFAIRRTAGYAGLLATCRTAGYAVLLAICRTAGYKPDCWLYAGLLVICRTAGYMPAYWLYVGLLARSQYSEGPATGHLDTGFSWFPCVYKQMLRWFSRFQVATTCFSCSPPDLNLLVTNSIFCIHVK